MKTIASMFSGGGGWEMGALAVGYRPLWGVEYIPEIAAVHARNVGHSPLVMDATKLVPGDLHRLQTPDVFVASPPRRPARLTPRPASDRGSCRASTSTRARRSRR